jgi:hypothetical protein
MTQGDAPSVFILCPEGDSAIKLYRDREEAESSMEAPDLEQWTVFDAEGSRRALSTRSDGAVAIGARVGDPEVNETLKHLRAYLEEARPERDWENAPLDALLEAAEQANRVTDAIDARRSRKIMLVVSIGVVAWIVWSVMRE